MRGIHLNLTTALSTLIFGMGVAHAQTMEEREVLPIAAMPFAGKIGNTPATSTAAFPANPGLRKVHPMCSWL